MGRASRPSLLPLLRRATLVTPNASEAGELAGHQVETGAGAEAAARFLIARDRLGALLVKGGHIDEAETTVTDVLVTPDGARRWSRPRVPGPAPRGTGCALATAIAVELGRGQRSARPPSRPRARGWRARSQRRSTRAANATSAERRVRGRGNG